MSASETATPAAPAPVAEPSTATTTTAAAAWSPEKFPFSRLMGDWHIIGSTLPLWKGRADVFITYTAQNLPSHPEGASLAPLVGKLSFDDEIWWEQLDKAGKLQPGKGKSRFVTVDGAEQAQRSYIRGRNHLDAKGWGTGASFSWRGHALLKPFTSQWQVLGWSDSFLTGDGSASDPEWIVTYFTASLFTPAGIDIYARDPASIDEAKFQSIVEAIKKADVSSPVPIVVGREAPPTVDQALASADKKDKVAKSTAELRKLGAQVFKIPQGVLDDENKRLKEAAAVVAAAGKEA